MRSLPATWRRLRAFAHLARPVDPAVDRALRERWESLPAAVKTPEQMLGQRFAGCEGTHGVFPRCNLACTPCYHSALANQVRIDAQHTLAEVEAQMAYMLARRGPGQHAQLIGGEVTLLGPAAHARVLEVMIANGRKPMSMSHGDFDEDYLLQLALDETGRRRFDHLSFALHIDTTMVGRRAVRRPERESDLNDERARVCAMFDRLRRDHGVRSYLAHNMTVTAANMDQVAGVVRDCRDMGFRMFSFQPAAAVGKRQAEGSVDDDRVWREVERGVGTRLPTGALQVGDPRCNRTTWGLVVADRYVPMLDDADPADLRARDVFLRAFRGVDFGGAPAARAIRIARAVARHPSVAPAAVGWALRTARRAGLAKLVRSRPRPLTFVMHSFMDAAVTAPAWELLQRGERAGDPDVLAAQERLQACSYLMAHPERDLLVPACAQHAVFDPSENARLRKLLPIQPRFGSGADDDRHGDIDPRFTL